MSRYAFLVESYRTERIKTLGVWSQVPDDRMSFRPEPRARTAHEHMVHQCLSEEAWMTKMLGITTSLAPLPAEETRQRFLEHYAAASADRLRALETKSDDWFEADTQFFDTTRSRAWVLTRRLTHSAHHRGQLTAYLRIWGQPLYSTYGPTADTGGLAANGATVIYPAPDVDALLKGAEAPTLPGPGEKRVTERE
jgi:uncharacterized damage-inducible protein DinB